MPPIFADIANWASVISLLISVITLFITARIKSSVVKQIEKTDYMRDIDNQLTELNAVYDALVDNQTPFNENYLNLLLGKLEVFPVRYSKILPKKLISQIESVSDYFDKEYRRHIRDDKFRRNASSQLHKLILTLEREKRVL